MSDKSPEAYRTISEVSDQLDVPQHVLRFWETKFPRVAPMKRAGNRRYYDPAHIAMLARIRDLLYVEGYTTKGVQKLLEEDRLMEGVDALARASNATVPTGMEQLEQHSPSSLSKNAESKSSHVAEIRHKLRVLRSNLSRAVFPNAQEHEG